MPDTGPVELLSRILVARGAGRDWSPRLTADVRAWLESAVLRMAAGERADVALGIRPAQGERSFWQAVRQLLSDRAMAELLALAHRLQRQAPADAVLEWLSSSPASVPAEASPHVAAVLEAGLDVPEDASSVYRAVARVGRSRACNAKPRRGAMGSKISEPLKRKAQCAE